MPGGNQFEYRTLTVKSGATTSNKCFMGGYPMVCIHIPTIDAGSVTFQGSASGSVFSNLTDSNGNQIYFLSAGGAGTGSLTIIGDDSLKLACVEELQVVMGVTQSADRIFTLILKSEN